MTALETKEVISPLSTLETIPEMAFSMDAGRISNKFDDFNSCVVRGVGSIIQAQALARDVAFISENLHGNNTALVAYGNDESCGSVMKRIRGAAEEVGPQGMVVVSGIDRIVSPDDLTVSGQQKKAAQDIIALLKGSGPKICGISVGSDDQDMPGTRFWSSHFESEYNFRALVQPGDAVSLLSEFMNVIEAKREAQKLYNEDNLTYQGVNGVIDARQEVVPDQATVAVAA